MSTQPKTYLTPEQYLEIESNAEFKSEYYQGEMFAMAGAGESHNLLVANLIIGLGAQLLSGPCRIYPSDMRLRVEKTGLHTYPDVMVVCSGPQFTGKNRVTLLNPTLIVEVLSPSTEAYDRGRKFDQYKSILSFQQYLLVASDRIHVDLFTRQLDGDWLLKSADPPEEDSLKLQSIGCRLTLADLYRNVDLTAA
jgi:Uma2 family endonuclease